MDIFRQLLHHFGAPRRILYFVGNIRADLPCRQHRCMVNDLYRL